MWLVCLLSLLPLALVEGDLYSNPAGSGPTDWDIFSTHTNQRYPTQLPGRQVIRDPFARTPPSEVAKARDWFIRVSLSHDLSTVMNKSPLRMVRVGKPATYYALVQEKDCFSHNKCPNCPGSVAASEEYRSLFSLKQTSGDEDIQNPTKTCHKFIKSQLAPDAAFPEMRSAGGRDGRRGKDADDSEGWTPTFREATTEAPAPIRKTTKRESFAPIMISDAGEPKVVKITNGVEEEEESKAEVAKKAEEAKKAKAAKKAEEAKEAAMKAEATRKAEEAKEVARKAAEAEEAAAAAKAAAHEAQKAAAAAEEAKKAAAAATEEEINNNGEMKQEESASEAPLVLAGEDILGWVPEEMDDGEPATPQARAASTQDRSAEHAAAEKAAAEKAEQAAAELQAVAEEAAEKARKAAAHAEEAALALQNAEATVEAEETMTQETPSMSTKSDKSTQTDVTGQSDVAGQSDKSTQSDVTGQSDKSIQSDVTGQSEASPTPSKAKAATSGQVKSLDSSEGGSTEGSTGTKLGDLISSWRSKYFTVLAFFIIFLILFLVILAFLVYKLQKTSSAQLADSPRSPGGPRCWAGEDGDDVKPLTPRDSSTHQSFKFDANSSASGVPAPPPPPARR